MTRLMSAGLMSSPASASAAATLTARQSSWTPCGPPTPVSTSAAPPGKVTTNPCTGHCACVPGGVTVDRCSRLISSATLRLP